MQVCLLDDENEKKSNIVAIPISIDDFSKIDNTKKYLGESQIIGKSYKKLTPKQIKNVREELLNNISNIWESSKDDFCGTKYLVGIWHNKDNDSLSEYVVSGFYEIVDSKVKDMIQNGLNEGIELENDESKIATYHYCGVSDGVSGITENFKKARSISLKENDPWNNDLIETLGKKYNRKLQEQVSHLSKK